MRQDKRLLILDDEDAVARTVAYAAEKHGFAVRLSNSPQDFFDTVARWLPTHILIDLVMPAMDGVEVLRTLAAAGCDADIIVMSGMGTKVLESAQRAAIERGLHISGILPKPFRSSDLRRLLDRATPPTQQSAHGPEAAREVSLDELKAALQTDQFILHYQPKINLTTGLASGVEALVRWQHPAFGLIYPDQFIALAEKSGNMDLLTYRIIEAGLDWLAEVSARSALTLAINVSGRSLTDVTFADVLHEQCAMLHIDPSRIILELTETSATQDTADVLDILTRVRLKGFQLSIDDFGTGYSSMMQLARLPFSEIKIDKSFVMSMMTSEESRKIVASTISLGRALQLVTVAEGVENAQVLEMLGELGCDLAQGYYIAGPMDGPTAGTWLERWDGSHCRPRSGPSAAKSTTNPATSPHD